MKHCLGQGELKVNVWNTRIVFCLGNITSRLQEKLPIFMYTHKDIRQSSKVEKSLILSTKIAYYYSFFCGCCIR